MSKSKKVVKTNAMRILDSKKIDYSVHVYPNDGPVSAIEVATCLKQESDRIFKTLVTTDGTNYFVFVVPGDHELDLKAGAKAVGVKKIEMLKQKDLFNLTGYIHGGCSPVGMKKVFPTVIDNSALNWDTIYVSGGKIGVQIEINPLELEKVIRVSYFDITKKE